MRHPAPSWSALGPSISAQRPRFPQMACRIEPSVRSSRTPKLSLVTARTNVRSPSVRNDFIRVHVRNGTCRRSRQPTYSPLGKKALKLTGKPIPQTIAPSFPGQRSASVTASIDSSIISKMRCQPSGKPYSIIPWPTHRMCRISSLKTPPRGEPPSNRRSAPSSRTKPPSDSYSPRTRSRRRL
jgi:hypothetical protein